MATLGHTTLAEAERPNHPATSLADVHKVARKWLGKEYDVDALNAVCAVAAAVQLSGDPVWLLLVSGPGAAKTETVMALAGAGAHITSTITSEGALLSATSFKSRSKKATGGLLRQIGEKGLLVIKDFTSIISADRNVRGTILAALREIYDGRWVRNVGVDGGLSLVWEGRIGVIGAVTTVWDTSHAVITVCGDRFVLLRIDSDKARQESGARAIANTGDEIKMRKELAAAVGGLVLNASTENVSLNAEERERILKAADIVTMARTGVEYDRHGNVIDVHAPEMPTRFAKELTQIVRGGIAVGMSRAVALALAIRCAHDSIPPRRLQVLMDLAIAVEGARTANICQRTELTWHKAKRELEALTMLHMLKRELTDVETVDDEKAKKAWRYFLADKFDRPTFMAMVWPKGFPQSIAVNVSECDLRDLYKKADSLQSTATHISHDTPARGVRRKIK